MKKWEWICEKVRNKPRESKFKEEKKLVIMSTCMRHIMDIISSFQVLWSAVESFKNTTGQYFLVSLQCSFQIIISDCGSPVATKPPLNFPLPNFTLWREQVCHVIVLAREIWPKKKLQIELAVFSKDLFSSWKHRRLEEGLALSTGLNSEGLLEKPQDFASHVSQLPIGAAREPPSTLASKS